VSVKDEVATKEEDLSTKQEDLDLIVAPEGADVKLKDIISLWTTNIMQMYGEADSVDGAPVAEVCAHTPHPSSHPPDVHAVVSGAAERAPAAGVPG